MSKGRMISASMWEDDFFTELSMFDRLVWIGLITCCADDQGRMQDKTRLLISQTFPIDEIETSKFENSVLKIISFGKLVRYEIDGKKFLQITNWWKHQTPRWAGKSNYPPPEKWIDRFRFHSIGNEIKQENWDLPGGFPDGYIVDCIATNTINDVDVNVNDDDDNDVNVNDIAPEKPAIPEPTLVPCNADGIPEDWQDKPKKKKPKNLPDTRYTHPAYTAYYNLTKRRPPAILVDDIIKAIGEYPDEEKLEHCLKEWVKRSYNPLNLVWLFDWYVSGIPGYQKKDVKSSNDAILKQAMEGLHGS